MPWYVVMSKSIGPREATVTTCASTRFGRGGALQPRTSVRPPPGERIGLTPEVGAPNCSRS